MSVVLHDMCLYIPYPNVSNAAMYALQAITNAITMYGKQCCMYHQHLRPRPCVSTYSGWRHLDFVLHDGIADLARPSQRSKEENETRSHGNLFSV